MKVPDSWWVSAYFKVYNFVAAKRIKAQDTDLVLIHTALSVVITTSVLMWAHAIVACITMDSMVPGIVGLICAAAHLFSPLLFRFSNKVSLVSDVLIFAGMVHQATYSFYSGGFMASTLIWFGILPMLGGLINGARGIILWSLIPAIVAMTFLALHLYGFPFPHQTSTNGLLATQVLIIFGWIFLSSTIIYVYNRNKKRTEGLLTLQGTKIDDLVRVLFHDLANPLGRISIGLNITKKNDNPDQTQKGIEIATQATEAMIEITQNVRKMYAISKGRADIDLSPFSIIEGLAYVRKVCGEDLDNKKMILEYNHKGLEGLMVIVEPVSFKNQVLCNIISNAIKFSSEGTTVVISAHAISKEYVEIHIKDQGIGMPQIILENLFNLQKKTSRSGTMGESGTGFGMHIMKSFIEMYDGEVEVKSTERKNSGISGTTFIIRLKGSWN